MNINKLALIKRLNKEIKKHKELLDYGDEENYYMEGVLEGLKLSMNIIIQWNSKIEKEMILTMKPLLKRRCELTGDIEYPHIRYTKGNYLEYNDVIECLRKYLKFIFELEKEGFVLRNIDSGITGTLYPLRNKFKEIFGNINKGCEVKDENKTTNNY